MSFYLAFYVILDTLFWHFLFISKIMLFYYICDSQLRNRKISVITPVFVSKLCVPPTFNQESPIQFLKVKCRPLRSPSARLDDRLI